MLTCDEIKDQLAKVYDQITQLSQPGVRSIRDTDGSEIQYSQASLAALREQRNRLEAIFMTLCGGCGRSGRPFGFLF